MKHNGISSIKKNYINAIFLAIYPINMSASLQTEILLTKQIMCVSKVSIIILPFASAAWDIFWSAVLKHLKPFLQIKTEYFRTKQKPDKITHINIHLSL